MNFLNVWNWFLQCLEYNIACIFISFITDNNSIIFKLIFDRIKYRKEVKILNNSPFPRHCLSCWEPLIPVGYTCIILTVMFTDISYREENEKYISCCRHFLDISHYSIWTCHHRMRAMLILNLSIGFRWCLFNVTAV